MISIRPTTSFLEFDMSPGCCDENCEEIHEQDAECPDGFWITCELHGDLEWFDAEIPHSWNDMERIVNEHLHSRHFA